jgi:hypothetical protein
MSDRDAASSANGELLFPHVDVKLLVPGSRHRGTAQSACIEPYLDYWKSSAFGSPTRVSSFCTLCLKGVLLDAKTQAPARNGFHAAKGPLKTKRRNPARRAARRARCRPPSPWGKPSRDGPFKVWELDSGRALRTLEGHGHGVRAVAVTPDGRRAVSASRDRTLKVWDLESGRALRTLEGHGRRVMAVAVTPDGRRAVSASYGGMLKVWDLERGRELRTLEGHGSGVGAVVVTPDGRRAVSASR